MRFVSLFSVQVLFGLVTGSEKQYAPRSSSVNTQEPYNILPLANTQIRSESREPSTVHRVSI